MNFLVIEGYQDVATEFEKESGTTRKWWYRHLICTLCLFFLTCFHVGVRVWLTKYPSTPCRLQLMSPSLLLLTEWKSVRLFTRGKSRMQWSVPTTSIRRYVVSNIDFVDDVCTSHIFFCCSFSLSTSSLLDTLLSHDPPLQILDHNPPLFFHLQQQRLIELIREGDIDKALEFAQDELSHHAVEDVRI